MMIDKKYPTLVIDDFFDNPKEIVELHKTLPFKSAFEKEQDYRWAGERTPSLHETHLDLFNQINLKILFNFFPTASYINYGASTVFQKISNIYDDGWVHKDDDNAFAYVIYLNENNILNAGTSIYKPYNSNIEEVDKLITKYSEYKNLAFKNTDSIDKYKKYRLKNNNMFYETIKVNNIFNRAIAYDASNYHKANNFLNCVDEPRLTLVGFINKVDVTY